MIDEKKDSQETLAPSSSYAPAETKKIVLIASGIVFLTALLVVLTGLVHSNFGKSFLWATLFLIAVGIGFAYRGRLLPAQIITSGATFITLTYFLIEGEGVHDASMAGYAGVVIVAGLLLGEIGVLIFGFLSTLTLILLSLAESSGTFTTPYTDLFDAVDFNVIWVLHLSVSAIVFFLIRYLSSVAKKSMENEVVLYKANKELGELRDNLQERVESRTQSLESQNQKLQAASNVARDLLNVKEADKLLDLSAQLVAKEFSYYHVGVFLIDKRHEYAMLQAVSSTGGEEMLARGHQLKVGSEGVVGAAAAEKRPRIALDVGEDAVYFNNPSLPQTHSEMALPLIVQGEVIGILDVQSTETQAFSQADAAVLQTLANQISLMFENTRLIEEAESNIEQLEVLAEGQTHDAWRTYLSDDYHRFRYTPLGVKKMNTKPSALPEEGEKVNTETPIMLRGTKIGSFYLKREGQDWTAKEKVLIDAVSRQVGLAIENARLVSQTRAQALQDQLASEFTTKLRETLDMDTVVKTALEEVQKTFKLKEVEIRLNTKIDES